MDHESGERTDDCNGGDPSESSLVWAAFDPFQKARDGARAARAYGLAAQESLELIGEGCGG